MTSNPSYEQLYRFVERIACYDDYTHDDIDEVKVLAETRPTSSLENDTRRVSRGPDLLTALLVLHESDARFGSVIAQQARETVFSSSGPLHMSPDSEVCGQ